MGFKWIFKLSLAFLSAAYNRCMKWSIYKLRKLIVNVVNQSQISTVFLGKILLYLLKR